jgi:hypothetical protein
MRTAFALVRLGIRRPAERTSRIGGRLELGAERHDQQHRQAADTLDCEVQQLARGRVNPMRVLENHDHRLLACQTL